MNRVEIERRFDRISRLVKNAMMQFAMVIITVAFTGVPVFSLITENGWSHVSPGNVHEIPRLTNDVS